MKNQFFVRVIISLSMTGLCFAAFDDDQYRAKTSFSLRLNDVWKVKFPSEFHFRDGEHSQHQQGVSFTYKDLADWLDVGLGYKLVYRNLPDGEWSCENRPYAEATVKKTLWGLKWLDRNRLEYRNLENAPDVFMYRNRLKMYIPYDLFGLPLQPYFADEIFVLEGDGMSANRLISGLVWNINKTLDVDFFYYYQKKKTVADGWKGGDIIGTELKFSF